MMEALRSYQSEKIKILLINEIKQFIIKDPSDESLLQLIVPVRTF